MVHRDAQQALRAKLGTLVLGSTLFMANVGQVSLDAEGRFRLPVNGRAVLWISAGAKQLQVMLMVCAHMKELAIVVPWLLCSGCRNIAVGFAWRST